MDTLTKSCSPTIVIRSHGEVQTLKVFLTLKVFENTQAELSFGKLYDENGYCCEWINGQNHISFKTGFRSRATRRTPFLLRFQTCQIRLPDLTHQLQGHFQDRRVIVQHLLQARLHRLQQVISRLENEGVELRVTSLQ